MKFGVIGLGQVGELLLKGLSQERHRGFVTEIIVFDRNPEKLEFCAKNYGAIPSKDELDCASKAHWIFVAIKPKDMAHGLKKIIPALKLPKILISTAAGFSSERMREIFPDEFKRIIRIMPNTPCRIGLGVVGVCFSESISSSERGEFITLMQSLGEVVCLESEKLMNAITALSGSGPAYIYAWAQAMMEEAVASGLETAIAEKLVIQTFKGAAGLMEKSGESMKDLISQVKTPGGTTEAALNYLESKSVFEEFKHAIKLAIKRGIELSKH